MIIDGFYPRARELRAVFDKKFRDPLVSGPDRFVWDFWHVPGEYTHLRTPAWAYFPKKEYEAFHRFLVRFGREKLGCHDISPPWLSCYIEGCRQTTHRDTPHGPLAYVFSLSRGGFKGGETFLTKPKTLIAPRFNRLTLFNPDIPHGVRPVHGTMDPRRGRLVIHGWFVQPRSFWTGPLTADEVNEVLTAGLRQGVRHLERASGFLSVRISIRPSGSVREVKVLMNTLVSHSPRELARFLNQVEGLSFSRKRAGSVLTWPLMVRP